MSSCDVSLAAQAQGLAMSEADRAPALAAVMVVQMSM
jgi:hypothetical protein